MVTPVSALTNQLRIDAFPRLSAGTIGCSRTCQIVCHVAAMLVLMPVFALDPFGIRFNARRIEIHARQILCEVQDVIMNSRPPLRSHVAGSAAPNNVALEVLRSK